MTMAQGDLEGPIKRHSPRTRIATVATVAVGATSRVLRLGSGSVIGGRVGLAINSNLLNELAQGRRAILVSGTNGKTTTTRLLVAALGGPETVATSPEGSNLPAGLTAALASSRRAPTAVLEVDEAYLGTVAEATSPRSVVLLNLSRDQLDRVNEVRKVAHRWRDAIERMPQTTIVANADDPLIVWAAQKSPNPVRFVSAGQIWHDDSTGCPSCGRRISFEDGVGWSCECGFERPEVFARLTEEGVELLDGGTVEISLALPARFNRANAAMAAVAANVLGVDLDSALEAMSDVREVEGRFANVEVDGVSTRLLLSKNPAGWAELLEILRPSSWPVVIGINARIADGHDPSWLWDVDFEQLAGRDVVATGERCLDLAVRLKYAGIRHAVVPDQHSALMAAGGRAVDYVGNYTAFQQLRRSMSAPSRTAASRPKWSEALVVPGASDHPSTRDSVLRIVVVHPDLLGTYGDGGNGKVLACRAAWRGLPVDLVFARSGSVLPRGDIYCLGGGEDAPQVESAELLSRSVITSAVENGSVVLAVCAGFQIVGRSFPDADGVERDGLGLLDVVTRKGTGPRSVGEVIADPVASSLGSVEIRRYTGFENHSGVTVIGDRARALGRVISGVGNGDGSRADGAVQARVIGTYLHGPLLARNPAMADALLSLATGTSLAPLDDEEEEALRAERLGAVAKPQRRDRRRKNLQLAGRIRQRST